MNQVKATFTERTQLKQSNYTHRLVHMAILAAISVLLVLVSFPIFPAASFLEYDLADIPVLLGALTMGPVAGLMILFVAAFIQAFFFGGNGIIGLIMHFVASGALVVVASLIYRRFGENNISLITGLILGGLCMTAIVIPFNLLFIPILTGVDVAVVKGMILPVLLPFNLLKAGLNAVLFFLLFKGRAQLFKMRRVGE